MHNELTAIIEKDGEWFVAYCPEIPGANGQGKTKDEARKSLADAIELILEDRREDAMRGIPPDASKEIVTIDEADGAPPSPAPPRVLLEARGGRARSG